MPCSSVVGLQWGDEAKGKIVDILTEEHDYVVRYNGGANAGHTVVRDGKTFKLSLLPTGVLCPHIISVIGNGVVVYPPRFLEEVETLRTGGIDLAGSLSLSDHAHVIFPYHMEEERLAESGAEGKIGTTGRGIGPCYQDKVGRRFAIRVGELLHPKHLRERLNAIVPFKNRLMTAYGENPKPFDAGRIADEYLGYAEKIKPYVTDTSRLLHDAFRNGQRVLFDDGRLQARVAVLISGRGGNMRAAVQVSFVRPTVSNCCAIPRCARSTGLSGIMGASRFVLLR